MNKVYGNIKLKLYYFIKREKKKTMKTWNQRVVKQENKSLVLETIIEHSPISRADIANTTGLNKGTVSSLVKELLDEQLIKESGPGISSGGRRPVMLLFNQLAGYSIGIDLGVNYILGILTDLKGNIHLEKQIKIDNLNYDETLEQLYKIIDGLISSVPKSPFGVVGIGVGVPGIVNNRQEILLAPNLGWKNVDLKSELQKKYKVPVAIENEANAGAYGEKQFGVGNDADNLIYVSVGIGIGVGMLLDGELYRGSKGFSGEFGHMTIELHGEKCSCGNNGCWELYASERALLSNAKNSDINQELNNDLSLEKIIELADAGNPLAIHLFKNIGKHLGIGINNIINIFNPEKVIIGNRMVEAERWLKQPLLDWIKGQSLWFNQQDVGIDFSNLRTYSTALGAAAFSNETFLHRSIYQKNNVSLETL